MSKSKVPTKPTTVKRKPAKSSWNPAPKVPKAPAAPVDDLAAIRAQYERAVKQLANVDATLDKEGLLVTVNVYSRSGKAVGHKQQRHPLASIQRALRSDVVRLARVLQLHKPPDEEPAKPGNARNQKQAIEKLYHEAWELFFREGEILKERNRIWRARRRDPWEDGKPAEWEALQDEIAENDAAIEALRSKDSE